MVVFLFLILFAPIIYADWDIYLQAGYGMGGMQTPTNQSYGYLPPGGSESSEIRHGHGYQMGAGWIALKGRCGFDVAVEAMFNDYPDNRYQVSAPKVKADMRYQRDDVDIDAVVFYHPSETLRLFAKTGAGYVTQKLRITGYQFMNPRYGDYSKTIYNFVPNWGIGASLAMTENSAVYGIYQVHMGQKPRPLAEVVGGDDDALNRLPYIRMLMLGLRYNF